MDEIEQKTEWLLRQLGAPTEALVPLAAAVEIIQQLRRIADELHTLNYEMRHFQRGRP